MDKNTAYVSTNLLLPYSAFNVDFCEVSLTMYVGRKKLKFLILPSEKIKNLYGKRSKGPNLAS